VFDILFFIVIITIILNVVFGIIIDSFAQLRENDNFRDQDIKNNCFICNLDRYTVSLFHLIHFDSIAWPRHWGWVWPPHFDWPWPVELRLLHHPFEAKRFLRLKRCWVVHQVTSRRRGHELVPLTQIDSCDLVPEKQTEARSGWRSWRARHDVRASRQAERSYPEVWSNGKMSFWCSFSIN
jgi:hypothetical protein